MSTTGIVLFLSSIILLVILNILYRRIKARTEKELIERTRKLTKEFKAKEEKQDSFTKTETAISRDSEEQDLTLPPAKTLNAYAYLFMTVLISIVIIGFGLYFISKPDIEAETKNWAFGSIGTVIGYWLKKDK